MIISLNVALGAGGWLLVRLVVNAIDSRLDMIRENRQDEEKHQIEMANLAHATIVLKPGENVFHGLAGGLRAYQLTPRQMLYAGEFSPVSRNTMLEAGEVEVVKPRLLDELVKAEHNLLGGKTGAGKTTLLKHLVKHYLSLGSEIVPISPHSPSILGIDGIGAGQNFQAIFDAIDSMVEEMQLRYQVVNSDGEHDGREIILLIDEFPAIKSEAQAMGYDFIRWFQKTGS